MSITVEETVLERVRKLIAKAESASKFGTEEGRHEADAFMSKAQEMIAEHAISEAMLSNGKKVDEKAELRRIVIPGPYAKPKAIIMSQVARANRCKLILEELHGGKQTISLIGFPSDLDAVDLIYTSLSMQVVAEVLKVDYQPIDYPGGSTSAFRRAFILGFANRVGSRLREAAKVAERHVQESHSSSVALVLADRDLLVQSLVRQEFPVLRKTRTSSSNRSGYRGGQVAGDRANLGQTGLGKNGTKALR